MFSNNLICNILNYIDENINSKITIDDLEIKFYYNRFYIMKLFKKEIGISIINYINSIRIYNSILDIKNSNKNLINIAFKNGFYSIEYFSETFKNIVGVNPKAVKDYFNKNNVSLKKVNKINKSISELYNLKTKKEYYLFHKKPSILPVKKLSIFK